ncbi:MAG: hypothetical protein R3180_00100 [Marinobacter sp.]|nr:hypothetical protein [Marinobacter sp.]
MSDLERIFDRQAFEEMLRNDQLDLDNPVYRAPDGEHVVIRTIYADGSATTSTGSTLSPADVRALKPLPPTQARR